MRVEGGAMARRPARTSAKNRAPKPPSRVTLTPAQEGAYRSARAALAAGPLVFLWGRDGSGRTTVLRALHRDVGGVLLGLREIVDAAAKRHPLAVEDAVHAVVSAALERHPAVFLDDWHVLGEMFGGCHAYPRSSYVNCHATAWADLATATGRRLVVASDGTLPPGLRARSYPAGIDRFGVEDYAVLLRAGLDAEAVAAIDVAKVHRFAPKLNGHQLRGAAAWLRAAEPRVPVTTDVLIEYLRRQRLTSNVELGEVRKVDLRDLRGMDDVIEALEANVVLPLENDALAREMMLAPRRGILLAGPPGTGKTTVGRALAHRLRGKFFLIDGTFISGTPRFYQSVAQVFEAAKENAPSVIFIDDSDVIFESGTEHGLYRYLLTMLDGLEGEGGKSVCVMMTAMDVGNLPPALVRSGRISLWLETRLPDRTARTQILTSLLANAPPAIRDVDVAAVVAATADFSGADLERLVEDAKALLAYDRTRDREVDAPTRYVLRAAEGVRRNREQYARAEAAARARRPVRPSWFSVASQMVSFDGPSSMMTAEVDEDD
jgi:AAA+ superfamily predicted ATPase